MKKNSTNKETKEAPMKEQNFALGKINWILIGASLLCIIIGFALMTGEASGEKFNPDIFSTRRLHVAPMLALFGFLSLIVGIMWPNKKESNG